MKESSHLNYILYARKSSEDEDRQVASIEAQVDVLRRLAEDEGMRIIDVLTEARSAKSPGRPVFAEMVRRLQDKEAEGILCWKLDRLARNPIDGGRISWMLQEGLIQHVRCHDRSYYPSDNVLMMSVEFGMANQYVRDLAANINRGLGRCVEKGQFPGVAPLGYLNRREGLRGEATVDPDPERYPLVRKMWDLMLTGAYSVPKLLRMGRDMGLTSRATRGKPARPVSRTTLYGVFTNPFYFGAFRYRGEVHEGAHRPMITEEEFWQVQMFLGRKGIPRPKQRRKHVFIGLLRCGQCGAAVTAEKHSKRIIGEDVFRTYTYYRCTRRKDPSCRQKAIREEALEAQAGAELARVEVLPVFHEWALAKLRRKYQDDVAAGNGIRAARKKAHDDCQRKLDALIDMRLSGDVTDEEFRAKKVALLEEKRHFARLLNRSEKNGSDWLERAERHLDFARDAREKFLEGAPEEKRAILASECLNCTLIDGKVHISYEKPLLRLEEAASLSRTISSRFEPLATLEKQGELAHLFDKSPALWRRSDLNRRSPACKAGAFPLSYAPTIATADAARSAGAPRTNRGYRYARGAAQPPFRAGSPCPASAPP